MLVPVKELRTLLTISEAAEMLAVDTRTMRRYANDGKIPVIVLPRGQRRFRLSDVEKILEPKGVA
jgi:excisionase family DNA binding protein